MVTWPLNRLAFFRDPFVFAFMMTAVKDEYCVMAFTQARLLQTSLVFLFMMTAVKDE